MAENSKSSEVWQSWVSQGYRALLEGQWSRACFAAVVASLLHRSSPLPSCFFFALISSYFRGDFFGGLQDFDCMERESKVRAADFILWRNLCAHAGGLPTLRCSIEQMPSGCSGLLEAWQ